MTAHFKSADAKNAHTKKAQATTTSGIHAAERFAAETDAMIPGGPQARLDGLPPAADEGGELKLAARLRESAVAGVPDPEFVGGLRQELLLRAGEKRTLAVTAVRYATLDTPIGEIAIAYRDGRIVYCTRFESAAAFERVVAHRVGVRAERAGALPPAIASGVLDHLAGAGRFTQVDISWLPPFQRRVLEKTLEIPRGEVRPYGWIAREIGSPGATRAVGTALGHNPIPFIIPCHRVVRSDGSLGEYSGGGPAMKVRVLEFEGAPIGDLLAVAHSGERYRGSASEKFFCYPSCHSAQQITQGDRVSFASVAAAQAAGYEPCSGCRPAVPVSSGL